MEGRIPFCCLPTPLHRLDRLSEDLGLELWVKRDDLTGFAGGGNKGRKLERLMGPVAKGEFDRVVTCGSLQSNFVRQIGAACSSLGAACTAVVMKLPYEAEFGKPRGHLPTEGGNRVLNGLFGVELVVLEDGTWDDLFEAQANVAQQYEALGERVFSVPIGGSVPEGALAFVDAANEVGPDWDTVVTASSSGSTQAGLAYGFHGKKPHVVGISCDPEPDIRDELARLCEGLDRLTGEHKGMTPADFDVRFDFVGPGYGVPSEEGAAATLLAARREGLLLDPVYTAKAFAGLIDMAEKGVLAGRTLFWHTGGLPTLFTY